MVHRCIPQCLFVYFWPHHLVCRILIPWPGVEPWPVAVKAWSPDPWTTREFLSSVFKIQHCLWAFGLHVAQDVAWADSSSILHCWTFRRFPGFALRALLCTIVSSLHAQVYRSYCCNPREFSVLLQVRVLSKRGHIHSTPVLAASPLPLLSTWCC